MKRVAAEVTRLKNGFSHANEWQGNKARCPTELFLIGQQTAVCRDLENVSRSISGYPGAELLLVYHPAHWNAVLLLTRRSHMIKQPCVWAFDIGKGSIGEAVRLNDKFLHKASHLHPRKEKGAAKAPCGSHRSYLAAEAARLFPTIRGRPTGFDPQS
jgi:hypothetical protein